MSIWFTADTHFSHANIIKYCNRPFKTVQEMDEEIIRRWNEVVKPVDLVYHLGDFSFGLGWRYTPQLNGQVFLIRGGHDRYLTEEKTADNKSAIEHFVWTKDLYTLRLSDSSAPRMTRKIVLCHYPMRSWDCSFHGSWHLYGHVHGAMEKEPYGYSMDIGVDTHNFYPWSYEEIRAVLESRENKYAQTK